jgi:hypothetical protein
MDKINIIRNKITAGFTRSPHGGLDEKRSNNRWMIILQ